jgi:NADPH:quinone reductase-like Zn-dependent oxidoreductase
MKAIIHTKYGDPSGLELREVKKPIPKPNEIYVKIHTATVTAGDCEIRRFEIHPLFWLPLRLILGILKPRNKILGGEFSGIVDSVGDKVTSLKKGDPVFAATMLRLGAYAEYICLPESYPIYLKPENLSFTEAATLPTGGINGLHFLKKGNVSKGDRLLIIGAGGSIGTYALQIAKSMGAEVTAVDRTEKLEMLQRIGADHVIDYLKKDYKQNGKSYDVIIDVVGKSSFSGCLKSLNKGGRYVLGNPSTTGMFRALWTSLTSDKKVFFEFASYKNDYFEQLIQYAQNDIVKPVIDRKYPLEQIPQAHRYVETGMKSGNVIIQLAD